ncbi:hypothetical protein EZV62_027446 [Acer yangbiense]|uniref:RNase H type-1 domain-containing protein n=1 Tax=Acer yangbiense TaxID=1000413 RepID=A0A5C7GUY1_9ROSI|nr:hypothetical protein EZV62_027446 [Acer yangbiense]
MAALPPTEPIAGGLGVCKDRVALLVRCGSGTVGTSAGGGGKSFVVGGRPRNSSSMAEFNECNSRCGLLDLRFEGRQLSWCNGHQGIPQIIHLFYYIMLRNWRDMARLRFAFRVSIFLVGKLKRMKQRLRVWNKEIFGCVDGFIRELEEWVEHHEEMLQAEYSESVEEEFLVFKVELDVWLKDLVINNVWDVEELQRLLGLEKADEVMGRVGKFRNSKDVMLWIPEKNGCFNTKSAWDVKVAFNCLSVDEKVRSVRIPIISACNCCSIIGIEDLDHILNKVIWRLWRRRCAARIEGKLESISDVWLSIKHWVQILSNSLTELNLDGSSLGNPGPAGGGGVLRDSVGNFIFGFSKFFGSCSNNEAELRAMVEGITICKHLGHDDLLEGFDFFIHHLYREGNKVADALACHGASGRNNVFTSSSQLPGVIKGLLHLDTAYVRHV